MFDSSPGGCQQGCSGRNSAATERTDRVATAFAEDTGLGRGKGTRGRVVLSWSIGWGLGVVGLLFDLGLWIYVGECDESVL